jgi:NNP family nitrate/nitrite transporter-like MFS transporter
MQRVPKASSAKTCLRKKERMSTHETTGSRPTGHTKTLVAAFLHFDLSFFLWVLIGALGALVAKDLHLSPARKGMLVAVPILSGAIARIPLGFLADRLGARRVGIAMLASLYVPLALGALRGRTFGEMLVVGALLGTAGASFSVALPLASRWYPPERQGLVMGIAAAGNSGTVVANLTAPFVARAVGWHYALGLAALPLTIVLIAFAALAREAPKPDARATAGRGVLESYRALARQSDLWWLAAFYAVTFGGYVGLTGFLPTFLCDQYALTPMKAGYVTAAAACAGSFVRPLGGWLADRVGAIRVLSFVFPAIAILYALAGTLPPLARGAVVFAALAASLGLGNGAIFQLVPQRFRAEIGLVTGIVGAIGGVGGFFLPTLLGNVKQAMGSYGTAFTLLAALPTIAFVVLRVLVAAREGWRFGFRIRERASAEGVGS